MKDNFLFVVFCFKFLFCFIRIYDFVYEYDFIFRFGLFCEKMVLNFFILN